MDRVDKFFAGSNISKLYSTYRPIPPPQIINKILDFIKEKLQVPFNQAVDVGCGSGQNTSLLAPHFTSVLGVDVSESQIDEARKRETYSNVQYEVGACDSISLPNKSAELISACAAAHWFDLPSFYKEVERVLIPNGVVALITYRRPDAYGQTYSADLNKVLQDFFEITLDPYRHPNLGLVRNEYKDIVLPYPGQFRDIVLVDDKMSVPKFVGLMQSWSPYKRYSGAEPEKAKEAMAEFQANLVRIVGESESQKDETISIRWRFVLIMSRKPT